MDEYLILESATLRQQLCTDEHTDILDQVGLLVYLPNTRDATTESIANFYEVSVGTLRKVVTKHRKELETDGYKILFRKDLKKGTTSSFPEISHRGLAIFSRKAVLRVGMLLKDSRVAKMIRTYLLDVEQLHGLATGDTLSDMAKQLKHQATQLSKHATQLRQNAEQLLSQSRIVATIADEMYNNNQSLKKVKSQVDGHDKRILAMETLSKKKAPEKDEEYLSQKQADILRARVKAKGKPATVWAEFRSHFKISRHQFLPRSRFREALDWLEQYKV